MPEDLVNIDKQHLTEYAWDWILRWPEQGRQENIKLDVKESLTG